jgi:(E)-4-hydroxy-3-methyl-but-2-enyl pyrophosphate reductase
MRVKVAKTAGFCMGVRRAMDLALAAARERQPEEVIHTYGPLIHNNQVLRMLEERGVSCLKRLDEREGGRLLIRAHGIPPHELKAIKSRGFKVINATCPKVARVQGIIKKHAMDGYHVVIVGDESHAEVVGLQGFANGRARVLSTPAEVDRLPEMDKVLVVAQTTQDEQAFLQVVDRLRQRFPQAQVHNTICDSTHRRQEEVRALCREVEAMVVVGGKESANTRRLAEIAAGTGIPTFHIETEEELEREKLGSFSLVGVTAGASTPNWLIRRVIQELESIQPRGLSPLLPRLRQSVRFLLQSSLYVACGAGSLCYAVAVLRGARTRAVDVAVTILYVFAMHVLNRYADKAAYYNDPSRAAFYERYRKPFFVAGIAATALALLLAALQGMAVLFSLVAMTALGLLYSVRLLPERWLAVVRVGKLKDIPASKTVFVAGAWSVVAALLPGFQSGLQVDGPTILALAAAFVLVFVRSAMFDLVDIQGDRFVGKETIPIVLGEKRTRRLLIYLVLLLAVLLTAAPAFNLATPFGYFMLLCCLYAGAYLLVYQRQQMRHDSLRFEAMVESNFYLAGALALIYQLALPSG